jgi:hypothetical protein
LGPGISGIDFWPKSLTIGVDAWLIGVHPLSTFLLMVTLASTKTTVFVVSVGVVPRVGKLPLLVAPEIVVLLLQSWSLMLLLLKLVPLVLRNKFPLAGL